MDVWSVLSIVLGSGVMVALVNLIGERIKRKDTVHDKRNDTAEQLEELRTETSERFG